MTDVLLVGYWPLLSYTPQNSGVLVNPEVFKDTLSNVADVHIDGCIWGRNSDGTLSVVFLLDKAEEVANHLLYWTEEKPEDWFNVLIYDNGEKYTVALYPNVQRSVERMKANYTLTTGKTFDEGTNFKVVYNPLAFSALISDTYRSIRSGDAVLPVEVGVLDISKVNREQCKFEIDDIISLGRFVRLDPQQDWVRKWADDFLGDGQSVLTPCESSSQ